MLSSLERMEITFVAKPGDIPLLSAEWINQRVENVLDRLEEIFDHLIEDGLLVSGFLPFETPLTAQTIRRMLPTQIQDLLDTAPNPEEKAAILQALEGFPAAVIPEPTPLPPA